MPEEIKELPPRKNRIAQNRKLNKVQLFDQIIWSINFLKAMTYLYLIYWIMNQFAGHAIANELSKYLNNWYQSLPSQFGGTDQPPVETYRVFTSDDLAEIVLWITGVIAFLEFLSNFIEIMKPKTETKQSNHIMIRWGIQLIALLIVFLIMYLSRFIGR